MVSMTASLKWNWGGGNIKKDAATEKSICIPHWNQYVCSVIYEAAASKEGKQCPPYLCLL
jgi:hypothetical protein